MGYYYYYIRVRIGDLFGVFVLDTAEDYDGRFCVVCVRFAKSIL